jgi:hypothetical protein
MSLYSGLKSTVDRLTAKYGVEYTFTHRAAGAYSPSSGTQSITATEYTAYGVRDQFSVFEKQSASIQVNDIKMICQAADFAIGDTVEVDSETYRIVNFNPIKPGGTALGYEVQLRK